MTEINDSALYLAMHYAVRLAGDRDWFSIARFESSELQAEVVLLLNVGLIEWFCTTTYDWGERTDFRFTDPQGLRAWRKMRKLAF